MSKDQRNFMSGFGSNLGNVCQCPQRLVQGLLSVELEPGTLHSGRFFIAGS